MGKFGTIDPIVSEMETADATNLSASTLRRMHARGEGPPRLRLSRRRVGYRLRDIERWLKTRAEEASGLCSPGQSLQRDEGGR